MQIDAKNIQETHILSLKTPIKTYVSLIWGAVGAVGLISKTF